MDIEDTRKACKRLGVKFAEANDRIYNEPPSMSFISRKHSDEGGLVTKACGPIQTLSMSEAGQSSPGAT